MISPILSLKEEIELAVFRIAPERAKELEGQIDLSKITLDFTNEPKFDIRVTFPGHVVKLPIPSLEYIWCCAHAFWVLYQVVQEAQANKAETLDFALNPRASKAIDLLNWSRQNMVTPGTTPWPNGMPKPEQQNIFGSDAHVADELFLCATAWIIHHEIAHVQLKHGQIQAEKDVQQEKDADNRATDWIFINSAIELETKKRQFGLVTALMAIQYLDAPTGPDTYVASHPPTIERLNYSLDRANIHDDGAVCAFVTTALQFHLGQYGIEAPLDGDSFRDILSGFLVAFATHNR